MVAPAAAEPAPTPPRPIRVVLVEDEPLFRDLLTTALQQAPQIQVVGAFGDAPGAIAACPACRPDVAIIDLELADGWSGVRVGVSLRRSLPNLGVLILSQHVQPQLLGSLVGPRAGGWSYLLKRSVADVGAVVRAIEGAAAGLVVVGREIVEKQTRGANATPGRLTTRQRQILELIAQGYTNAGIADRLKLASKSVENQINIIYQALGIEHRVGDRQPRVQAVLTYLGIEPGLGGGPE